ncbi:hypothetical protein GCM10010399_57560 [Dactylosporangium fulvum]
MPVKVEAQQEFRDGLRAMLMATAEREGIGVTAKDPEPETARRAGIHSLRRPAGSRPAVSRRTRTRGAIVVGLAAGTLALSGMSAASGDAIPGDALYTVKRSTEKAQLALAGSDISRGQLYLEFARTRLDEAHAVKDPNGLTSVLDDMDNETLEGVRLLTTAASARKEAAALDAIESFTGAQRTTAEKLLTSSSGDARTRVTQSVTLLEEIDRRSKALRPLLKCGSNATSAADKLGPVPNSSACKSGGQKNNVQPPGAPQPSNASHNDTTTGERPAATVSDGVVVSSSPTESTSASPSPQPSPSPSKSQKGLLDWLFG